MVDFTKLTEEEIEKVIKAINRGADRFFNTQKALEDIRKEFYGDRKVTAGTDLYLNAISKGTKTIEDYRSYLQDKKTLEEEIMKSLDLPEYVEIKDGKWVLDYSEITDRNDERKMVIEYKLKH